MYVCVYIYIYIYIYFLHTYIHTYPHIYIYIYIHIFICFTIILLVLRNDNKHKTMTLIIIFAIVIILTIFAEPLAFAACRGNAVEGGPLRKGEEREREIGNHVRCSLRQLRMFSPSMFLLICMYIYIYIYIQYVYIYIYICIMYFSSPLVPCSLPFSFSWGHGRWAGVLALSPQRVMPALPLIWHGLRRCGKNYMRWDGTTSCL